MRKILAVALVIAAVIGMIWVMKPWEILQKAGEEEVSGENQITGPVLFSYEASFQYLSSDDNGPIERELYLIFPCPNIDNESVVSDEDITWQIWAYYEENGVLVKHLQMENNIPGEFVPPRENAPWIPPPGVLEDPRGPKIWYQSESAWKVEETEPQPLEGGLALYQNEVYRIEAEFTVPGGQADEVTLANDRGEVWVATHAYATEDNFEIFDGKAWAKLSKWNGTRFETIFENSSTEWKLLSKEWQCYRLDA